MDKIKIEKDIYVRDEYNVRRRAFIAGEEVDAFKYNEAFRLSVPVNPEDLPQAPEFVGTESLNGRILVENKSLFVPEQVDVQNPETVANGVPNLAEPSEAEEKAAAKGKNK